jgi:hypothetical protein
MPIHPVLSRSLLLVALVDAGACATDRPPPREPSRASSAPATSAPAAPSVVAPAAYLTSADGPLVAQQGDTGAPHRVAPKAPTLTEAEQQMADRIVFAPRNSERFLVAARNKRLLLDIGRVDVEMKKDAELLSTLRRVSARIGPLANVARVQVRGSWGEETDSIVGYDVWNGRAVALLATSPHTDSLLRKNAPLVGVATREARDVGVVSTTPTAAPAPAPAPAPTAGTPVCVRDSIAPLIQARVSIVRDSLVRWMTDSLHSPFARFVKATTVRGDAVVGCFGPWRAVVVGSSRTPTFEWNEERVLLVALDGKVVTGRLRDLRLRAHESLMAFDADGDGIDELSARGLAARMGAQSVLKLDPPTRRFSRFASGFAWETR